MDIEIEEEELMEMYADADSHVKKKEQARVIDIDSDGAEDNECEQAVIESELFEVNKQIEVLMDKKDTLMARKNALEEQNAENKRKRVCLQKQAKLVDPKQEETLTKAALKYFNISKFRPLQIDTMLTSMKGEDCILIMPTGGGKSLTFQLPAVVKGGVTVVVSPLLSLMEDQVTGLRKHGVNVSMITGTTPAAEQTEILKQMADPSSALKLLYVTPEKISKAKRFQTAMEKCYAADNLTRIVVDEVHCVSEWGHDFRPDYKILATLKRQYPGTPILGLTATATSKVLADVQRCLRIPQCKVLRASFNRANLHYEVIAKASGGVTAVCEQIATMIKGRFAGQSGLIYCFSRNDCESVMGGLSKYNLRVAYYHASLDMKERSRVHQDWLNNRVQCIVATVAFGMGIDKPDVRWIVHHTMSKSIENYYQESGRAGRDGAVSKCVLLYQPSDYFRISTMVASEASGLSNAYDMLGYCITGKCRRVTLAKFFGETFSESDCNKTCDRCNKAAYASQDITQQAIQLLGVIQMHAGKDKDLTFHMLVKEWSGGKLSGVMKENVVCSLIHQAVLTEKFKAGMYKLLSYIIPGAKSRAVKVGNMKVVMDVPEGASAVFKAAPATTVTTATTTLYAPPTHSVLTQPTAKSNKQSKKRKAMQFDSDSD